MLCTSPAFSFLINQASLHYEIITPEPPVPLIAPPGKEVGTIPANNL